MNSRNCLSFFITNSKGRLHDSAMLRPSPLSGLVRQRFDGFISTDADHRGG